MPREKVIPDSDVEAYRQLLNGLLDEKTGVSWEVEHEADPWNIIVRFECRSNSPDYASVSKQIHSCDFPDGAERVVDEFVEHSAKRAIALREIGVTPEDSWW